MNDKPIRNVTDFEKVYESIGAGKTFLLQVVRPSSAGLVKFKTALTKPE